MITRPTTPKVRPPLVGGLFQTKDLIPDLRNARKHSRSQIERLKAAILGFGFTNPLTVLQRALGTAGYMAQYQQNPIPAVGNVIKL